MAKARQLKSGKWNVKVFSGYNAYGKRIYKSITRNTEKEANYDALEWQLHYKDIVSDTSNLKLDEAITGYINLKSHILSPATIRGYENIRKNKLNSLMPLSLSKISNQLIQREINNEAGKSSPKTVRNIFGLLSAVLKTYRPDFSISISLPQKIPFRGQALNGNQISKLLSIIQGDEAEIPILLALWMGLRRSEITGLKWDSIDTTHRLLTVRSALVPDKYNHMVEKGTKTTSSYRTLRIPQYINEKLKTEKGPKGKNDFVVSLAGDTLRKRLLRLCTRACIPQVRLHDLRHTMASIGLLLNIGDKYMMERGGWSSAGTMKTIYQHTIAEETHSVDDMIDEYFTNLMQHEMQHED